MSDPITDRQTDKQKSTCYHQ